jgi:transcriptional regulator with XRE-family HTH domain
VNPLQELIRSRMAEQRWSFADVARRGALPHSTVHYLATNKQPSRPPHPQTIARLAEGLDLPVDQVRAAAAEAAGFTLLTATSEDPEAEILVAALGRLSHEDRRHVAALVRSLLENGSGIESADGGRGGGEREVREPLPDSAPEQ